MPHSLVLFAAGLGTRFGGLKPLAPVGPHGEPLLAIAVAQGRASGFTDVIVIVSEQSEGPIAAALGPTVRLARQERIGPPRATPWGTVAAVLAGGCETDGCVVANGDDLYGIDALRTARAWIDSDSADESPSVEADALLVAFRLDRTLSDAGGVSRAVAQIEPMAGTGSRLRGLREHRGVRRTADGLIKSQNGRENQDEHGGEGGPAMFSPDALVSMNLWAFRPSALEALRAAFETFIEAHAGPVHRGDDTSECALPTALASLAQARRLVIEVRRTDSQWHGVTWPADVAVVRAALQRQAQDSRNDGSP